VKGACSDDYATERVEVMSLHGSLISAAMTSFLELYFSGVTVSGWKIWGQLLLSSVRDIGKFSVYLGRWKL
jgi:hypothetical protein